ncbi:hypothetical protein H4582DRAFT_1521890 [Lactarius indigo]|nr:hypothetical protein H4582DRAFT_1521890 [Lactarius indigo]
MMGVHQISTQRQQEHSFALHKHLRDGTFDDGGHTVAFLAQQRRRNGEAGARARLDEPPAQWPRVIYIPCEGTLSTMARSMCSSPAMLKDGVSLGAGAARFGSFADTDVGRVAAKREWITGASAQPGCERPGSRAGSADPRRTSLSGPMS